VKRYALPYVNHNLSGQNVWAAAHLVGQERILLASDRPTVATGVTAYLKNGGTPEKAAQMANYASTRMTQLYDRRAEEVTLDEVERILV
jgi:hypothetical protein